MHRRPFAQHELETVLNETSNGATGDDMTHVWLVKHAGPATKETVLHLFNVSYAYTIYPTDWKHASVVSVLKSGKDGSDPRNYRPIVLLSCLGKLM